MTAWLVFGAEALDAWWLALPVTGFATLVVWHDRTLRRLAGARRGCQFYERGLARLQDRWSGEGAAGEEFRDPHHPYADDLDLFGDGSLFQLLCAARTRAGEDALARWLLAPAPPDTVAARQAGVSELAPRLDLRETLARLGDAVRAGLHPKALREWGATAPDAPPAPILPTVASALSCLSVGGLGLWIFTSAGPAAFAAALLLQAGFAAALRRRVRAMLRGLETPARDLPLFAELLACIESEPGASPELIRLRAALHAGPLSASRQIARLARLVDLLDARRNQIFAPIAGLLLWGTQLAFAIERWKARCGPRLGPWLDAAGEFEALSSLAQYAYERPGDVFPEWAQVPGAHFEATALGHPLLPVAERVVNDVPLRGDGPAHALRGDGLQALVVSGSNMSGKSTLLRAVGVNTVLALAGAPVCATSLRLSPLTVAASIRIVDSLREGHSRFYAEILRLRHIMELAGGARPVLFLLDEILHGTNSHDRGIGAEAVVRGLLDRGAIGLVTTHDLALARVADALGPRCANVHFEDHLEAGALAFDYRMRPGVVEKSNALELMRAVGLEV